MYKRKNIPRTTHPEFLSVEEQLVSSKLFYLHVRCILNHLCWSQDRVQPVANSQRGQGPLDQNRRMDEYPS